MLRDEYDIQIEFGDLGNILAYLSIGDRPREIERLVSALSEVRRRFGGAGTGLMKQEYIDPKVAVSPGSVLRRKREPPSRYGKRQDGCAVNLLCAIRLEFPFWHRENRLQTRF